LSFAINTAMPKCGRCDKQVYDAEEVSAAGKKWHQACFKCKECSAALSSSNLRDNAGEIYCGGCYGRLFGAKGYGFGGGGGVGLASGNYDGQDASAGSAAIDAEIQRKLAMKYNADQESKVRNWLQILLEEKFDEPTLQEALKNGQRICKAANKISPNIVKNIGKQNFAASQREKYCQLYQGVSEHGIQ